jgi:hypothetical protein
VNNELEWMQKEVGCLSRFQLLSKHLSGETEKDDENPQDGWFAGQGSNLAPQNTKEILLA